MSQYNCHYFSGINEKVNVSRFMPWLSSHAEKFINERFVLCRVTTVDTLFPSRREMVLMNQYGTDATNVNQVPQIIQQVTLQVIPLQHANSKSCVAAAEKSNITFTADLFPNEL